MMVSISAGFRSPFAGIRGAAHPDERRTPVTSTYVELRFTDARGRQQVVYAAMRDSGVWDVRGIVGDHPFSRACDGWQAVERTVFWLQRHAHEQPAAPVRLFAAAAAAALVLVLGGSAVALAQIPGA